MPLFSTRKKCIQGCGGPPPGVACYKCDIQPGESRGRCIEVHPSDPVTRDPLKKCPQWPNIFPTRKECQDKCTSVGPVDPVAICWTSDSECKCQKGQAEGPHGPLSSCDPNLGFYNTQGECVKACEDRKPDDSRTLWIVLGVVGGVLLLLIIIGVILYFVWRRS